MGSEIVGGSDDTYPTPGIMRRTRAVAVIIQPMSPDCEAGRSEALV